MGRKAFDFQKEKLSLAFWKEIDYTIKVNSCRCDGMVDVVDSKSTASDGVPVRVRSPAPKAENATLWVAFSAFMAAFGLEPISMPNASGIWRPPVQKLVASIRFAPGQIGYRVRHRRRCGTSARGTTPTDSIIGSHPQNKHHLRCGTSA